MACADGCRRVRMRAVDWGAQRLAPLMRGCATTAWCCQSSEALFDPAPVNMMSYPAAARATQHSPHAHMNLTTPTCGWGLMAVASPIR